MIRSRVYIYAHTMFTLHPGFIVYHIEFSVMYFHDGEGLISHTQFYSNQYIYYQAN